jgi:hypothetical protein
MADLGRLRLGRAVVLGTLAGTAAGLYFALKLRDSVLVSNLQSVNDLGFERRLLDAHSDKCWDRPWTHSGVAAGEEDLLGFHLVVLLLERVDLAANQLNFLDMAADCWRNVSMCMFATQPDDGRVVK